MFLMFTPTDLFKYKQLLENLCIYLFFFVLTQNIILYKIICFAGQNT